MSALDELLRSFRANPDREATIALCTVLARIDRPELNREVQAVAEQRHLDDGAVMLGVGQMFLEVGSLIEAQAAFVAAGKADGKNPEVFRHLGEVLLRRGDAARAEKVLARASSLLSKGGAASEGESELYRWQERARMFVPLQSRLGSEAVAREVARAVPRSFSLRPPPPSFSLRPPPPETAVPVTEREFSIEEESKPPRPGFGWASPEPVTVPDAEIPPSAERILAELESVGLFERREGALPAWERPPRDRSRTPWILAGVALLTAGAVVGGTVYARQVTEQKVALAASLCDEAAAAIQRGDRESLTSSDAKLSEVFDLDPGSLRAARLWLENRVMHWLVRGTSEGIEGAIQRLRRLDAPPPQVAFGTVAVRLAEGDVPGALNVLQTSDDKAKGDALYQMLAGLTLERVGDAGCLERYEAAVTGDPTLRLARVLRARALLSIEGAEAKERALEGLEQGSVDRRVLELMGSAFSPFGTTPEATAEPEASFGELPLPLRWIPGLAKARRAIEAGETELAQKLIGDVLADVDTPDAAVRVGELSLALDSPALVRKAALSAISLSPVHVSARLLAARAAAEAGRLDEAFEALEGLDAGLADAASLRAVIAYERGDVVALGDAVDALPAEAGAERPAIPLLLRLLVGGPLPREIDRAALERPEVLWGRLALSDSAWLRGDVEGARTLLAALPGDTPPVARRLAALARLGDRSEEAVGLSATAFEGGATALGLIERVQSLLAAGQTDQAREAAEAHAARLGPQAPWLLVLIDVAQERLPRAKARAATLAEPPAESPLSLRVMVAQALLAIGDRGRGRPLLAALRAQAPRHPEVRALPAKL